MAAYVLGDLRTLTPDAAPHDAPRLAAKLGVSALAAVAVVLGVLLS